MHGLSSGLETAYQPERSDRGYVLDLVAVPVPWVRYQPGTVPSLWEQATQEEAERRLMPYLPDELRSYKHADDATTSMMMRLAADMIEHHIYRGDSWFATYLKQVEAESLAARQADELAGALSSYLVRSDIGQPTAWVLETYKRYQEWFAAHRSVRTDGGVFGHPNDTKYKEYPQ